MCHDTSMNAPRNLKQIYNRQYKHNKATRPDPEQLMKNQADEVQAVMGMCGVHPMVQHVGIMHDKSPTVILYSEENLNDLRNVLEHHPDTIIGVDRTFNLGNFFNFFI